MSNMESLYNELEKHFNDNQEKINYFLDVLKNVKEDRWEYECKEERFSWGCYTKKNLFYDNINIINIADETYYLAGDVEVNESIIISVDNKVIYKEEMPYDKDIDDYSEIFIEILDFIERAEKRAKGE